MDPVRVGELAEVVRERAPSSPLDRLDAALGISGELNSAADELLGHFVDDARRDGCSWTDIGQRLGVSKQAARQRFVETTPLGGGAELRPRLRLCLEAAAREAQVDGAQEIGEHHQLIGLFTDGVAAAILERLGVRVDAVRAAARDLFPGSDRPPQEPPMMSPEARAAIECAARLARRGGCAEVGTEHLLAAFALDPGSRARRVLAAMDVDFSAIKKELACYIDGDARRRRRGRKGTEAETCSFCGKRRGSGLRLVAGPGVWICQDCVGLCNEIFASGEGA
jgi:hypothetical protein